MTAVVQIHGHRADDNDNDPVEVRKYDIIGTDVDYALGYPTSPIWSRSEGGSRYWFWQYFQHGIIISSPDTCACVLYGPIYDYWVSQGQFDGWLGAPSTDVRRLPGAPAVPGRPPPPPRPAYAVFQGGVLYLDTAVGASVVSLSPVPVEMVQNATGVLPTGAGIAQLAQQIVQDAANDELKNNQHLRDNVDGITASATFVRTGPGGCSGASFNSAGNSLLRSHILRIHFDMDLSGCAGAFGDAGANVTAEVRLFVDPPRVTARLVRHSVDSVASPFSAGDHDIRAGLNQALNGRYGRDLLNRQIPRGITVIAGIVNPNGDVDLYIEPICASMSIMASTATAGAAPTVGTLRRLRDSMLTREPWGGEFVRLAEAFGPPLAESFREDRVGSRLREGVAEFLVTTFPEDADDARLEAIAERLREPTERVSRLIARHGECGDREWPERFTAHAVAIARRHLVDGRADLAEILDAVERVIAEEEQRADRTGGSAG